MQPEPPQAIRDEIKALYKADSTPWVVGWSGGKDSTATLQLVWLALSDLEPAERTKAVHVMTTDTQVENPMVAAWAKQSIDCMIDAAQDQGLPIHAHRLTPVLNDSFWVNLLGRGYAAPRQKHRWCTDRLKIKPSNRFIRDTLNEAGEVILVLGTRRAESIARGARMARQAQTDPRAHLADNESLPGTKVYSPIEDWSTSQVWSFLLRIPNPWGVSNRDLKALYASAEDDEECPVVMDTNTPSCGKSRFGCWTCTMVNVDKSMQAMVRGDEHAWMRPLLAFRNELDFRGEQARARDRARRDFRRANGKLYFYTDAGGEGRLVPGPYNQEARTYFLQRLLETQNEVRAHAPPTFSGIELISIEELREIRRIWVEEKHEIEDLLPSIYEQVTAAPFPDGVQFDEATSLNRMDLELLAGICGDHEAGQEHYRMLRGLLAIENGHRNQARRHGLFDKLEGTIARHGFAGEADALDFARRLHEATERATFTTEEHSSGAQEEAAENLSLDLISGD